MGFSYDQIKRKKEQVGNHWASYSDLFMVLAFVFLLLFVSTSLRTGSQTRVDQERYDSVVAEVHDLREQIRVYDTLKKKYIDTGASESEVKVYNNLMDKLSLLQEDATNEKLELQRQAMENAEKADALNRYQKIIRNIINANMIAQQRINERDTIIQQKEVTIQELDKTLTEKQTKIADLQTTIEEKEKVIDKNNEQISKIETSLQSQIEKLRRSKSLSAKRMQREIRKLKSHSARKIASLQKRNQSVTAQLTETNLQLKEAKQVVKAKSTQAARLEQNLKTIQSKYEQQIAAAKSKFQREQAEQRKQFEANLAKQQLSAKARIAKEREFRKKAEQQNKAYNSKLAGLEGKLKETKGKISTLEKQKAGLAKKTRDLASDLQASEKKANRKKILADRISKALKKAGVKANVDPKTGDVLITFGKEYFDKNRSKLKPSMIKILRKFIPAYSQSLLSDKKIANEIKSVELIGFASPTYGGKYVDPSSLNSTNRKAVNYNMDLSYRRAKSIFNYIFDTKKLRYTHQKELLPLVKVTGRSYLASRQANRRELASKTNADNFCKKYNCKESQRVIIKFNLDD